MVTGQPRRSCAPNEKLISYATIVSLLLLMSLVPCHQCLEQDANLLRPVVSLLKSIVSAVTTGVPEPIDLNPMGLARDLVGLSFRTGFPVTVPRNFSQAAMEFFTKVKSRVDETDVRALPRKRLAQLKDDLDAILDGIVGQVSQSPDGLYTNYLSTRINGQSLEEALVAVGTQLKAYGVDLAHYRDLAGKVLGIPLLPTLASSANQAAGVALRPVDSLASLPSNVMGAGNQLAGAGLSAAQQLGSSIESSLRDFIPPLSIFGRSPASQIAAN